MRVEILDEGVEIVECPGCGKRRPAKAGIYVCSRCATEFAVHGGGD